MHGEYKVPGGKLVVADVEVRDGRLADAGSDQSRLDRHAGRRRRAGAGAGESALPSDAEMFGSAEAVAVTLRRALA